MSISLQERRVWTLLQVALLGVGLALVGLLFFHESLGVNLFWNLLIPVAPALVVIAPGLWRNICPVSTFSTLPRKMGLSRKKELSDDARGVLLLLLGVILLVVIVTLRHPLFNQSGLATGGMLVLAALAALYMGTRYNWKSAWCTSLCPIHPVEKLYGIAPAITFNNAHCTSCALCTTPCPDATVQGSHLRHGQTGLQKLASHLVIGGLSGYLAGWYMVPDTVGIGRLSDMVQSFYLPLMGMALSFTLYGLLYSQASEKGKQGVERLFTTAAIVCYYWFRLPMLFGYGLYPGNGMLVDLIDILPIWFPYASQSATTLFFIWFLMIRPAVKRCWAIRPPYEKGIALKNSATVGL